MQVREEKIDEFFYQQLLEEYPNREVKGLYSKNYKLYKYIKAYCEKIGITIEEYITALDFVYGRKARSIKKDRDEILRTQLLEVYPDKVIIGLTTDYRNLYGKVDNYAKQNNMTQEEYLTGLGFDYTSYAYIRQDRETDANLLNDLKNIQGKLEEATDDSLKRRRSKELVDTLKKLYSYTCQVCEGSPNSPAIPRIVMANENYYVEVHHIQPISAADDANDDSKKLLDTYLNVVVVCTHHHKVLHYGKGGFNRLIRHQGKIHFVSEKEELLPIYTNLHLKA